MKSSNKIVILVFTILLIVCLLVWLIGPFLRTANAPTVSAPSPSVPASTFSGPEGTPFINGPAGTPPVN